MGKTISDKPSSYGVACVEVIEKQTGADKYMITSANEAFASYLDLKKPGVTEKTIGEIFADNDNTAKSWADFFHEAIGLKYGNAVEIRHPSLNKLLKVQAFAFNNCKSIIIIEDVTHVKGTIAVLDHAKEKAEMFKAIAEQAVHGSAIADLDGRIIYINDAFASLHGYTKQELIGKHFSIFHNESQLAQAEQLIRQMHTDGSYPPVVVWHMHRDGAEFPMLMSGSIIKDGAGNPKYLSASGVDISELMQTKQELESSELRYRYIADNVYDGILVINHHHKIIYVSPSYLKLMGRSEEEELSFGYDEISELVHPEDREVVFPKIFKAIEGRQKTVTYTYRALKKDGSYVWREDNSRLNYDQSGTFLGSVTICRDISERKKVEQELIRAKEKAEENDRFKTAFLQNISHEVRTPLNGILGFLNLLSQKSISAVEQETFVEHLNVSARRLLCTMDDIIKISDIETGHAKINKQLINTKEVMLQQHAEYMDIAIKKEIEFTISQSVQLEYNLIMTDESALSEVFGKLLNNAFKFTNKGHVDFGNFMDNGQLVFYVKDSGIGISKDDQERIFERFVQADMGSTRQYEGTGLGLTLAKAYVTLLGGKIWLESEPGKGTAVFFSLPLVHNDSQVTDMEGEMQ